MTKAFSPHVWGCTVPMQIGCIVNMSFPHMRGGVPDYMQGFIELIMFYLHAWELKKC